ncbi:hypothetical protein BOTBODRAFT_181161 [Botryobasidium botryosum FD-172 SS1]|uniref:Fungal-type protein kinase domain-containing protein n=1 Tax=Botryobasidium botryosum (strain FD-172 SS1) TaxID=930990 RepID=A0A067M4V8_BOTB1|nr:hypothetical protein BOTBODRAFT_181161 [Botryobasidium botryosum FD-172 SS1]
MSDPLNAAPTPKTATVPPELGARHSLACSKAQLCTSSTPPAESSIRAPSTRGLASIWLGSKEAITADELMEDLMWEAGKGSEILSLSGTPISAELLGEVVVKSSWIVMDPGANETESAELQMLLSQCGSPTPFDVVPWDLFDRPSVKPEFRRHYRLYFKTRGKPLSEATSPYEMLEACDHAMISMFKELYFQIRRNVMLLATPEERPAVTDFDAIKDITLCRGMLIDGDLAKKIEPHEPLTEGLTGLGTLPFISIKLLRRWADNMPTSHTPLDDAESFTWVKLWRYLVEAETLQVLTAPEKFPLAELASARVGAVLGAKYPYILYVRDYRATSPLLENHIRTLLRLTDRMYWEDRKVEVEAEGSFLHRYRHVYEEYFKVSFQFREENEAILRQPWAEFLKASWKKKNKCWDQDSSSAAFSLLKDGFLQIVCGYLEILSLAASPQKISQ